MKYYFFSGEINSTNANELLQVLSEEKKTKIYLSSEGGECYPSEAILKTLNERKDDVELEAVGDLESNAFYIFFSFKGKKSVGNHAHGMFHFCGQSRRVMENGRLEYKSERYQSGEDRKRAKITRKWCEDLGFTKAEMRKMENGDYLFFSNQRLQELLNNQT